MIPVFTVRLSKPSRLRHQSLLKRSQQSKAMEIRNLIGSHDIVFITLDTLRYDVAVQAHEQGLTPSISERLPASTWEKRHSPASFTFAAHQAFFAGFLPTPTQPGKHPRIFAADFIGSETTTAHTYQFEESNIVSALRSIGYHSICIGGVGFFNKRTQLGSVLPSLFDESHWTERLSVTDRDSTQHQVDLALEQVGCQSGRVFLFINVSALHQPNCIYLDGASDDNVESQRAALAYVDKHLGRLWQSLSRRGPGFCILCSDHGTAYGEDGYQGHRIGHSVVWEVPYAEFVY